MGEGVRAGMGWELDWIGLDWDWIGCGFGFEQWCSHLAAHVRFDMQYGRGGVATIVGCKLLLAVWRCISIVLWLFDL